jgi:hypothetical protein
LRSVPEIPAQPGAFAYTCSCLRYGTLACIMGSSISTK